MLQVLNLTRINGVTSQAIKDIAVSLPDLRELYLYADASIDDEAFKCLSNPETSVITKLVTLDLCGCQLTEDESIIGICR